MHRRMCCSIGAEEVNTIEALASSCGFQRMQHCLVNLQGDVRVADDVIRWVAEAVKKFGHLDILVNCAAGNFLVGPELAESFFQMDRCPSNNCLSKNIEYLLDHIVHQKDLKAPRSWNASAHRVA